MLMRRPSKNKRPHDYEDAKNDTDVFRISQNLLTFY